MQQSALYNLHMRRLFALLALLSGLAAVGAPANSAVVSDVCERVATSGSVQAGKRSECECANRKSAKPGKVPARKGANTRKPTTIYLPTVQFGADRAYE